MLPVVYEMHRQSFERHVIAWFVAGVFAGLSVVLAVDQILQHFIHYRQPSLQKVPPPLCLHTAAAQPCQRNVRVRCVLLGTSQIGAFGVAPEQNKSEPPPFYHTLPARGSSRAVLSARAGPCGLRSAHAPGGAALAAARVPRGATRARRVVLR